MVNDKEAAERTDGKTTEVDDLEVPGQRGRTLKIMAFLVLLVAGVGVVTTLIGIGPFGYRLFRYGSMRLFVYNGTPHFVELEVDGASYELKPYTGETLELVGGELTIDTTLRLVEEDPSTGKPTITDKREHLETLEFTGDGENWLYHVATPESTCLGIADMSSYYNESSGGTPDLLGVVPKSDRLQVLDYEDIYYPQDVLPDKASPPVVWLGVLSCDIIAEPELAITNLQVQAEETRELLERKREALRQQQQGP